MNLLDYDWCWQDFGDGELKLVTNGGGAKVVLDKRHKGGGRTQLTVRDPDGFMVPMKDDHPIAVLMTQVPAMVRVLREISVKDDRPRYLPAVRAILELIG